jgi:hypothetical protein
MPLGDVAGHLRWTVRLAHRMRDEQRDAAEDED